MKYTFFLILLLSTIGYSQTPGQCLVSTCNTYVEYPIFPDTIDDYINVTVIIDPPTRCQIYDENCYAVCKPDIFEYTYGCKLTYEIKFDRLNFPGMGVHFGFSETILTPESKGLHFCQGCFYDSTRVGVEREQWNMHERYFFGHEHQTLCCGTSKKFGINIIHKVNGVKQNYFAYDEFNDMGIFLMSCSDCEIPWE